MFYLFILFFSISIILYRTIQIQMNSSNIQVDQYTVPIRFELVQYFGAYPNDKHYIYVHIYIFIYYGELLFKNFV